MNIFNIKLIGEEGDVTPKITRTNTVIQTQYGGWKMLENCTWDDWKMCIIFPDNEKAEFFLQNFKTMMLDYRDGMMKNDYFIHIIHFKYPKAEELYADQLKMDKNWVNQTEIKERCEQQLFKIANIMLHTYSVIKKDGSVFNHLTWKAAEAITDDGDLLLTIKDNHISNVRKLEFKDEFGKDFRSIDGGNITPYYQ